MVCAPVRSIIPSLKLGDYLSVQVHKPCSISHLFYLQLLTMSEKKKTALIYDAREKLCHNLHSAFNANCENCIIQIHLEK